MIEMREISKQQMKDVKQADRSLYDEMMKVAEEDGMFYIIPEPLMRKWWDVPNEKKRGTLYHFQVEHQNSIGETFTREDYVKAFQDNNSHSMNLSDVMDIPPKVAWKTYNTAQEYRDDFKKDFLEYFGECNEFKA